MRNNTTTAVEKNIIDSINLYLEKNKAGTTDFSIIKDIVDRNCDALEDEIQSQLPFPLYLGLMGTMAGILVGVAYLVFSRDLSALLSNGAPASTKGIEALMGGVALAMICSIAGIIMTTVNTNNLKKAKARHESRKHAFLTFLQTELLPNMNNGAASAMRRMTDNLNSFNKTFKDNVWELKQTLGQVNDTSRQQNEMLDKINNMQPARLAKANIEVYEALHNSSGEIKRLAELLGESTDYIQTVIQLNEKLDEQQELTRLVKEMSGFFKESRDGLAGEINKSLGKAQESLDSSTQKFHSQLTASYDELSKSVSKHQQNLENALDAEQKTLSSKLSDVSHWIDYTKQQTKDSQALIKNLNDSIKEQNNSLDKTLRYIENVISQLSTMKSGINPEQNSILQKILRVVMYSLIIVTCLIVIIIAWPHLLELHK